MAALDMSTVVALTNKAFDLKHAGHRARSLEYEERALAAALARGAEDCLVVANLQLDNANSLLKTVAQHLNQRVPGAAPPIGPMFPLFFAAAATVQRRKAAGTLLPGTCRAAEVEWDRLTNEHVADVLHQGSGRSAAALLARKRGTRHSWQWRASLSTS
jgi:hypothetical protein